MAELSTKPQTLNEIVFANRNKEYGAYLLRKEYNGVMNRATLIGIAIFSIGILGPSLLGKILKNDEKQEVMVEMNMMDLPPPPPIDNNEPPPPPPPPIEQPKVTTVKFLPPEVKKDEEVPEETPPPTIEQIQEAVIARETVQGDEGADEIIIAPEAIAAPSKGTVVEAAPVEEKVFTIVEQQPAFPGGVAEMYKYLSKNMKYPPQASRANISGKVHLTFVVNTDGSIQDVQVVKGLGFGCDEEAKRVVQSMPKWNPGKQSGRPVRVKFNLPVTFQLEE